MTEDKKPGYNLETAETLKTQLEELLASGKQLGDKDVETLKRTYLEIERGIYRINKEIDSNCQHVPPWKRQPNQIVRDISDVEKFSLDESGLAERFSEEVKGWLVYDPTEKHWFYYDGDHWTDGGGYGDSLAYETTKLIYKQLIYETPEYMSVVVGGVDKNNKPKVKIAVSPDLERLSNHASRIHTRELFLRAATSILSHIFTAPDGIPFKNGLYNLETGEMKPLTPEIYNRTVCNVELDLDAPTFPLGEKFFDDISCHDKEWTHSLLRLIAESLRRGNPHHILIVLFGIGNNGKGVFIDWLFEALGGLIGDCAPEEISRNNKDGRQTTICLNIGKMLIIVFKEAGGIPYDDDIVKRMTGEKRAPWKCIGKGMREVEHIATPILITNNLPTVENGGKSMIRRQYGVSFDMELEDSEVDETLLEKLATPEGNVWLVSQIVKTLRDDWKVGKTNLRESMCPRIKSFTKELLLESDSVYQFIEECIEITHNDSDKLTRNDLYTSFQGFAYSPNGLTPTSDRRYRITSKKFGERLKGHKIKPLDHNVRLSAGGNPVRNVYTGIRLSQYGLTCVGWENQYYVLEVERR